MESIENHQITKLLRDWDAGNEQALDDLIPLVYQELRVMARRYINKQPAGHLFQTTELIHEAYLKLERGNHHGWRNREHFFGVASTAMRHILVDHARSRNRLKRSGWQQQITFTEEKLVSKDNWKELVALDDALKELAKLDRRKVKVVEMKFFGGLKTSEIAEVLKISSETVKRDWSFAQAWLLRELAG